MKQLLVSALTIWTLLVTLQLDNFSAEISGSLLSPSTQEQMPTTLPDPNSHQTRRRNDDDYSRKTLSFCLLGAYNHVSDDLQQTNCTLQGDLANCSFRNLSFVPQDLPPDIRVLDLSSNCLVLLPNFTFARYSGLEYLNVSDNLIKTLETNTFYNLSTLKELKMRLNMLPLQPGTYPSQVFCPLKSLTYLDIAHNNYISSKLPDVQYPDVALSCLRNLESLALDGISMNNYSSTFHEGFRHLTKLTTLVMEDDRNLASDLYHIYCLIDGLYSHSFENLETLEILVIKHCGINGSLITGKPFHNLRKLQKLDISLNTNIGIEHLQPIFDGLYYLENLTELNIGTIVSRYSLGQCFDGSVLNKFPPHLTTLIASDNNLEAVNADVIGMLPVNLTTLDLSGNRFTIGIYLRHLNKLKHLTALYLNGHYIQDRLPQYYPYKAGAPKPIIRNCTIFTEDWGKPFIIRNPPQLARLEMNNAGLNYDWYQFYVIYGSSLLNLSLSGNHFQVLERPVTGAHSLKYLDLSRCAVREIGIEFFHGFRALEDLRLDSNDLGDFLSDHKNEMVFYPLTKLKFLNLTDNAITNLPPGIFKNLISLTSLYLRKNPLISFDVDLRDIVALSILDLAHTFVSTLSEETQAYFDNLIKYESVNVSIYMENTPISCKCPNLQFLQWMTKSPAFPNPLQNYYCDIVYFNNPSIKDNYEETMTILRKQCASNAVLLFLAISLTLALCSLIIGAIVYRFRWNIRYLYYAVYLRFKKNSSTPENEREYDAFICYASEDAEFAEGILDRELSDRGLRIFLHGRDFKAGDYVSANIVNAVCSCKKTVVLLTDALLDSYWCGYEIEMAKLEGITAGRPVLIFVFLENIPKNRLSRDLLYNIKNNTYVEYTSSAADPDQMRVWWDKLANDIKD